MFECGTLCHSYAFLTFVGLISDGEDPANQLTDKPTKDLERFLQHQSVQDVFFDKQYIENFLDTRNTPQHERLGRCGAVCRVNF